MNPIAIRNIPEEWTPKIWQEHVTKQEKRINELERDVHRLKEANLSPMSKMSRSMEKIAEHRDKQYDFTTTIDQRPDVTALGAAWLR